MFRASEDRNGKRYVAQGASDREPRWIAISQLERMPDKADGILAGVRSLLDS